MNRKDYQKPAIQVMNMNTCHQILAGSVTGINSNAGLTLSSTGGNGDARSREFSWDDED